MAVIIHYCYQGSDNVFMETHHEEHEKLPMEKNAECPFLNLTAEALNRKCSRKRKHFLFRASCRIRTNDPEITNHVLWPTELKRRVGKRSISRRYNQATLAAVKPWGGSQGASRIGLTRVQKYTNLLLGQGDDEKKVYFCGKNTY